MGTYFAAHPIATSVTSMPKLLCRPEHVPLTDASTSKAPTPATTHWAAVAHVGDASLAFIPEAVGSVAIHTPIFLSSLSLGPQPLCMSFLAYQNARFTTYQDSTFA